MESFPSLYRMTSIKQIKIWYNYWVLSFFVQNGITLSGQSPIKKMGTFKLVALLFVSQAMGAIEHHLSKFLLLSQNPIGWPQ